MCPEFADRFSGLHEQRLVIPKFAQGAHDRIERFPTSRGAACSAVNNKPIRIFGHVGIEIVHQTTQRRFLVPAFARKLRAVRRPDNIGSCHAVIRFRGAARLLPRPRESDRANEPARARRRCREKKCGPLPRMKFFFESRDAQLPHLCRRARDE